MIYHFTEEDAKNETNVIYLEEDQVLLKGEVLEGEGKNFVLTGTATIDDEIYHDFQVEFQLVDPADKVEDIMSGEWDWYDYLC